jgi:hypothetical protein
MAEEHLRRVSGLSPDGQIFQDGVSVPQRQTGHGVRQRGLLRTDGYRGGVMATEGFYAQLIHRTTEYGAGRDQEVLRKPGALQ